MKPLHLPLVLALATLGLHGCDINVKPPQTQAAAPQPVPVTEQPAASPAEQPAATQAQQPAAPVDATPTPAQAAEAPAPATQPGAPADASASAATTPAAPATTAMGAQPGDATLAPDGVAAPTELARFFEQNVIKPKAQ